MVLRHLLLGPCTRAPAQFIYRDSIKQQQHSSSVMDASLHIKPSSLEQRFWCRRCSSRLNSLDTLYELCNSLIWLSILPMLEGSDRGFAKASLLLAVLQLAAITLSPRLWVRGRSMLLSSALLLRCTLQLAQASPAAAGIGAALPFNTTQQQQHQHQQHAGSMSAQADLASGMTVASGLWGNLLFVLFHQQPVRIQVPLLAVSSLLQALAAGHAGALPAGSSHASTAWHLSNSTTTGTGYSPTTPAGRGGLGLFTPLSGQLSQDAELLGISQALNWGFGLLAAGGINPDAGLWQLAAPPPETSLLATKLFVYGFGGFLLPVFVAYVIEWRYKVSFLLTACNLPQQQQLKVLTPAAAVVRASLLLALLLYLGWLLLLATSTWLLCCGLAGMLLL